MSDELMIFKTIFNISILIKLLTVKYKCYLTLSIITKMIISMNYKNNNK